MPAAVWPATQKVWIVGEGVRPSVDSPPLRGHSLGFGGSSADGGPEGGLEDLGPPSSADVAAAMERMRAAARIRAMLDPAESAPVGPATAVPDEPI